MRRFPALLLATSLLALSCGGGGDTGPPALSVEIVDETGLPVVGARVQVLEAIVDEQVGWGLTDDEGVFAIVLPEPGSYVVANLHFSDDPPCWWDIPRSEFNVGEAGRDVSLTSYRVCT